MTLHTETARHVRPLPMPVASWWPRCRAAPAGPISPRKTSSLTLRRTPAPVRRATSPRKARPGARVDCAGRKCRLRGFRFDAAVCRACPLRDGCVPGKSGAGRTVQLHPQEILFQRARALQRSPAFNEYRKLRVVEHRLVRLMQLGIRQARYIGRVKTKFQLYLQLRWPT